MTACLMVSFDDISISTRIGSPAPAMSDSAWMRVPDPGSRIRNISSDSRATLTPRTPTSG